MVAELPGSAEIVVIGAHYDSAVGTPGADDNASGVAALLVLARELRTRQPRRTLRFVAFTNEEPPWFHGPEMGARHHARAAKARGDEIVAMLSLESIGYYRDEPGSQRYPAPFGAFYPDRGDFLMFVGNVASTGLVRRSVKAFRSARRFPSEGAAVPASIPGVDWSDHRAFWEEGYKALMITDTAPNRNPRYHEPDDTADTVDVARLSLVVSGLRAVIEALAGA